MMRSAQGKASKTISCRPVKSGGSAMQASNTPPHHPPGVAFPTLNPAGKVERKSNRFESRMNSSASGIPGGAFLCTFVLFGCFQNLIRVAASILCSLNHYLAKYAPKRHILPSCGPSWGASSGPEGAAVRVRQSASRCQSRTGLKVEPKSKRSQSRRGIPCLKVE